MGKSAPQSSDHHHNTAITFVGTVNDASTATAVALATVSGDSAVKFVHELPQADEERLERLFRKLDRDGNGRIDIHDLSAALRELGMCHTYAEVSAASELCEVGGGRRTPDRCGFHSSIVHTHAVSSSV